MNSLLKFIFTLFVFHFLHISVTAQSCTGVINTFPFQESFESPNQWAQWNSAAVPWLFAVGSTPTPNTGPNGASDGLGYMYVEATNNLGAAVLLSPCFDLTAVNNPELTLDYHLWGPDAFRFLVQASIDGGTTWSSTLLSATNDQGPNWNSVAIDISQFSNQTNFRLRMIGVVYDTGGNDLGDVALDNVKIEEAPLCFDISVDPTYVTCNGAADGEATLLVYPANTQGLDILWSTGETTTSISNLAPGNYSVEVTDNNLCTKTKDFAIYEALPLDVKLYVTPASGNGQADGSIQAVVTGGIQPYYYLWKDGSTGATNFNVVNGYEELTLTDANGCTLVFPTFVPVEDDCSGVYGGWPYHLSFEGGLGRFEQGDDDDINWKRKSGSTSTSNTGPSSAAQDSKYRYLESSGSGSPYKTGVMTSKRCFNISNLSNPELYFQYHMYGAEMGQLFVQTSTDGGNIWRENLWEISGDQGNNWNEVLIDLSGVNSSTLMIRIVGRTGSGNLSDIAIDDLHIRSAGSSWTSRAMSTRSVEEDEMNDENQLITKYFPNPANDKITVQHTEGTSTLNVIDLQGQKVISIKTNGTESNIDMSQLNLGMYILQAVDKTGKISLHKVLKI